MKGEWGMGTKARMGKICARWFNRGVKCRDVGIPWRSIGWDSVLSQPRTQVQSLVGELRSHKPYNAAKKKNHKPKTHTKKS